MSLSDQLWCPTNVQVTVLQARGLRIKGKNGTNDAYAVMQVGKEKFQTSVAEKSVAPVWKEEASFDMPSVQQAGTERGTLHVHVLHRALVGPDKLLGQAVIDLYYLSEDRDRDKTQWFKLLDKAGKPDKDRGEVLVDVQFTRNNMTASMFDISAAGKSRSRLGKFKDKVRGKKKDSDTASNVVPFSQVLTDSEGERDSEGEGAKDEKKKNKVKSLFSPKSNLHKSLSQSMSVLPGKNSSLSGSMSSGLNVEPSEGKKKFKFLSHKRSGSSDKKNGLQKLGSEQSNLCINGSHVYYDEPAPRTSRASSNFSISSSGVGSMDEVPDSSPPSVGSGHSARHNSPWTEEEEEEETMEEATKEMDEEMVRRQELEKLAEEESRIEEEQQRRVEEEEKKREEERMQREEEERRQEEELRLEQERLQKEATKMLRVEEERRRLEEEEKRRRVKEEEQRKREEEEKQEREGIRREEEERRAEEARREEERLLEEQKKEQERIRREEEERLRMEMERAEEERRIEEEEKKAQEEEKRRREREEEERVRKEREEEEKLREEERRKRELEEQQERIRKEEEKEKKRIDMERAEEERRQREEERVRKEQQEYERQKEEEQRRRREEEEEMRRRREEEEAVEMERLAKEKKRLEKEERKRKEQEEEEQRRRREEEEKRLEEEERVMREEVVEEDVTNPFNEDGEYNPFDDDEDESTARVTSARQRCKLPLERNTCSEKDLGVAQQEKRQAPKPPQMNSSQHEVQTSKPSKDKEIKTASVLPQRAVKKIASSDNSKQPDCGPPIASARRKPAPQRPELESKADISEGHSLNPFKDDIDKLADQHTTTSVERDASSQMKIKSSKPVHAPAPPPMKPHRSRDTEVTLSDINEDKTPAQNPAHKESKCVQEEAVKKDAPAVPSRRLQPVRPLNPLDQQPVQGERDNKSTGEIFTGQKRKAKVNDSGPYALLTQEELISLVLKQEKQLFEKNKKISELEQYIDNLLVRVIEEAPSVLMSMAALK